MLDIINVLVESRINRHVFCSDSESLSMFVLVLNVEDKGDARGVLGHHFLQKAWREVYPFDHE